MREGARGKRLTSSLFPFAFSLLILPALAARPSPPENWTALLSGDADGYLSPCGCTSPMQGGMKRRASALRAEGERVVRLDNGGLVGGTDRQGLLKAYTAAQAANASNLDAVNLNSGDAGSGEDTVLALANLSGHRLVSTSLRPSATAPALADPWRAAGPFLIGGATARPAVFAARLREEADPPGAAARHLVDEARGRGLAPILLFDGSLDEARGLARDVPELRLVTYRSTGHPRSGLDREGACALASPGERGKAVVRLAWRDGAFVSATSSALGPEWPDDPAAKALYDRYLRAVTRDGLLDALPHAKERFAGSTRCAPCHAEATRVWAGSDHFHALKTLEAQGHGRDPECVPCHVVGVARGQTLLPKPAFWSRATTPALANVGCESCHGAAAAHAAAPRRFALPKIGSNACLPCHTLENSPNFTFAKYWARIKH